MKQTRSGWATGSDGRSTAELLRDLADGVQARQRVEVEEFRNVIAWADANVVEDLEGAATIRDSYVDTGIPIAGPGAPLVSEFGLSELVATLGRSLDGGRDHVGKVIECGWRLPRVRDAVYAGKVPVWKALRVADLTRTLTAEAAAFVDRNLAFALPTCTWVQVERLVAEAIARFDPQAAEERRKESADHRHFTIHPTETGKGVTHISGVLDAADAMDLDQALSRRATVLGQLGCEESLDVRRSIAAGELARHDLSLDLPLADPDTGELSRTVPGRKVELFVHLTDTALTGISTGVRTGCSTVGRWGNTQTPVSVEQIRRWCAQPGTSVIVRPVVDLAEHVPVDSYEIPDRLRRRVELRDHTCRAPHCNRRAERCDLDHAHPHAAGGSTCPCNLVPLCRRHHRAKTFGYWRYVIVQPGTYLWSSPHGQHWLVDHTGTRVLDPPRPVDPEPDPDPPDWADPDWTEPAP
ncbi:HNH endonuclease signature motif containing protein [Nocardioides pelophilus]|uniref:HNH endonuclease signature motif containing protein n=1 Tax=Nocardioides pelophilus TaxID=2172019 RepID=UPI00160418BB|nr:HNH endonuclease signature motif containing protein [Nocardioides pelophilus]